MATKIVYSTLAKRAHGWVHDETGKSTETELMNVLGWYSQFKWAIVMGDPAQLQPVVQTIWSLCFTHENNPESRFTTPHAIDRKSHEEFPH